MYSHEGETLDPSGDHQARPEPRLSGSDRHRPGYHFLPPANWMNDPNGLIQWNGVYHMFYQYNPLGAFHHKIQWGHATSTDLAHWTHHPIALAPTPGSPDQDGCFSGCALDNNGVPTIIYSGHSESLRGTRERPCIAICADGSDNLLTWQKYPGNPVIEGPPQGLDIVEFRDHSVWKEGDTWYQVIGAGIHEVGGAALLYKSTDADLLNWEYMHPLFVGDVHQMDPVWTGSMWECPDFFSLGEGHVLVVSVWFHQYLHYSVYFSGTYSHSDHRFRPEPRHLHKLDFGASFYAPQTLRDEKGQRIMFGWLREERDEGAQLAAGWSGVMSLPRILSLRPDGMLDMRPAPEIEMLRGHHWALGDVKLVEEFAGALAYTPADVRGDTLEIVAEFDPGDAMEVGITVRCSPDRREQTRVLYDCTNQHLVIDASQSSLDDTAHLSRHAGPLHLSSGETVRLWVFLDRSVVEVFANERACATARIYPTLENSLGVSLFAHGGTPRLVSLDAWQMQSIWTEAE